MHDIPNLTCYNIMYYVLLATSGVNLSLKGVYLAHNSYVDVDDIGEYESALICSTNKTNCCHGSNRVGEWYFPNGSSVQSWTVNHYSGLSDYFYRDRGEKVVRLHRVQNPPERGHFYCQLPDSNDINQTLHVNICEYYSHNDQP